MLSQLLKIISDGTGEPSTMRVAVFIIILAVLVPAAWHAISTGSGLALSAEDITLVLGALGAKVLQKQVENKDAKPEVKP